MDLDGIQCKIQQQGLLQILDTEDIQKYWFSQSLLATPSQAEFSLEWIWMFVAPGWYLLMFLMNAKVNLLSVEQENIENFYFKIFF